MPQREQAQGWRARAFILLVMTVVLVGLLAGCSIDLGGGGSGSSSLTLGLAGSTSDHSVQPPTLNGGPNGTLAFVYDDQIWLSKSGQSGATQLTHLVLSNGANIAWGPLVWSQSGRYIAFALVQNLTPTAPGGTSGPIFYVDTQKGPTFGIVYNTGATGSVYGHSYAWFGDSMLFYATGGGILMFGPVNADPRTWQVISQIKNPSYDGVTYTGGGVTYSDIAIGKGNGDLFYSQIVLSSPGSTGTVGSAAVFEANLPNLDGFTSTAQQDQADHTNNLPGWIAQNIALAQGTQVADLGSAYTDASGDIVTGAWNISPDEHMLAAQHINSVDTKHGTVSSGICMSTSQPYGGYSYCAPILGDAGKAPLSADLEISISPGNSRVAYTNGTLYIAGTSGSGESKLASAGWTTPPAWATDNKTVIATQLASSSTDANGVIHNSTNILTFSGGSSGSTFISGGANPSWYYGS
jgi:hypothetical protein